MNMHKEAIVGVEHFRDRENQVVLLNEFIRDPDVVEHVPALWVPREVLNDRERSRTISEIASSAAVATNRVGYQKIEDRQTFCLIYDTSSSGGVEDTLGNIDYITRNQPAPRMIFCISPTAYDEGFRALKAYADLKNQEQSVERVSYLLAAPYPENEIERVEELEGQDIASYVGRISLNAEKYGMGMVGAADLAKYTKVGQLYVALGVCANAASDYEVESKIAKGYTYTKRLCSPEITYAHATNTASHVGRTLFETEDGTFQFPYLAKSPNEYDDILNLVKHNFFKLLNRLYELPAAIPLDDYEQKLAS